MSDQTVLIDQFLSSVISTIHPDEIFDSIIVTAVRLLSPDGLLLTIRDDVSPSYHVTRSFGDITWEKDSFLDSSILLEQLLDIDGNFVDDNTVRVNIKRLRQKLNDEKQEYIVTVFGMGYSFGE